MAFIGKFNFNNTTGINMTDQTHKIRLTLSKNDDTELFLAIDKLNSRRRSYRLIELAKLGLHIEGRMHGTLEGLINIVDSRAESAVSNRQHDKSPGHAIGKAADVDPFADDLKAIVDS